MIELTFSSLYIAFDITLINSSGATIVITYGAVHNWWLSHPNVINTQGFIQVCHKLWNNSFFTYICIQATGEGYVSGTFKILVKDEEIQVEFYYAPGKNPTLTSKKLTPGPYIAQITNGPYAEGMTASCTLQVVDPQRKWSALMPNLKNGTHNSTK